MIHLYKAGGDWTCGQTGEKYTIKAVNEDQIDVMVKSGWKRTLKKCFDKRGRQPQAQAPLGGPINEQV